MLLQQAHRRSGDGLFACAQLNFISKAVHKLMRCAHVQTPATRKSALWKVRRHVCPVWTTAASDSWNGLGGWSSGSMVLHSVNVFRQITPTASGSDFVQAEMDVHNAIVEEYVQDAWSWAEGVLILVKEKVGLAGRRLIGLKPVLPCSCCSFFGFVALLLALLLCLCSSCYPP